MCLGVPGRIESVLGQIAQVDFAGNLQEVHLNFVPEAKRGDYVLVHVGIALSIIDEQEAEQTLKLLKDLAAEQELS